MSRSMRACRSALDTSLNAFATCSADMDTFKTEQLQAAQREFLESQTTKQNEQTRELHRGHQEMQREMMQSHLR